jgi:hypothetical protein
MLDECEHFVVLKYKNNILKHHTRYPSDFQFPKDGIKQDGNYITVESASKGNCRDCIGIDVFKIKNDKILSIGYFLGIEGNFLVSLYTELETNNITSHATSPIWTVYYKENDGKLILDTNKTCNNFDEGYIENKNNLFKEIRLREKSGKTMLDEIEIYDSVLSILSYSKWCGFENESLEIVTKIRDSGLSFNYEIRQLLNKYISETKKLDDSSVLKKIHGDLNNDVESIAR